MDPSCSILTYSVMILVAAFELSSDAFEHLLTSLALREGQRDQNRLFPYLNAKLDRTSVQYVSVTLPWTA